MKLPQRLHTPSRVLARPTTTIACLLLLTVASGAIPPPLVLAADDPPVFLLNWGSGGTLEGQFDDPWGIAVDPDGNVWVADYQNSRVQKFSSDGDYLAGWGYGSDVGQFKYPIGAASDSDGNIYITDRDNYRVQKFKADTETWSVFASGFGRPAGIAVAGDGQVFVIDGTEAHVEVYDSSGTYLTQFGASGTGDGQFYIPSAIAVDSAGDVYVADSGIEAGDPSRVQKFAWDSEAAGGDGAYVYVTQFSSQGDDDGQTIGILGIVVDPAGGVYVTDCYNHRVQRFTYNDVSASYEFALKWGTFGTADGLLRLPTGIALHPNGDIYVTEEGNDRVQAFTYRPVEGDANLDGVTNITDAMFIAQYSVGLHTFDATQLLCADTTDEGLVNIIDAMHVAQFSVDPTGDGGVLFKDLWESPADDDLLDPLDL